MPVCGVRVVAFVAILVGYPYFQAPAAGDPRAGFPAVDPFTGSQGGGHVFPGAVVPSGAMQMSPDTMTRYFMESHYRAIVRG